MRDQSDPELIRGCLGGNSDAWEALVNRKGTTWRQLDEATRAKVVDAVSAHALLCVQPSAIKRPVVRWSDGRVTVGFEADEFDRALGA